MDDEDKALVKLLKLRTDLEPILSSTLKAKDFDISIKGYN